MSAYRLLATARDAWPDPTPLRDMPTRLGKVLGDICGAVRDGGPTMGPDLQRELGNLVLMAVRYADDLGFEVDECVAASVVAQQAAHAAAHRYLSTACLHGEHTYCAADSGLSGAKVPASCKWCAAACVCPCHTPDGRNTR